MAFPSPETQAALQSVAASRAALAQASLNLSGAAADLAAAQTAHDAASKAQEAARAKHQTDCEALHASISSDTGVPAVPPK